MAAAVPWPEWMPMPLRAGYGFTPVSPLESSRFISGATITRRKYTSTPTMLALTWHFPLRNQAALFEKWVQEDLVDGSLAFLCKLETPIGLDFYRSQFTADFYEGPFLVEGDFWQVSTTLQVWRRPLLADGSTKYPDAFLRAGLVDIAANKEWPEA